MCTGFAYPKLPVPSISSIQESTEIAPSQTEQRTDDEPGPSEEEMAMQQLRTYNAGEIKNFKEATKEVAIQRFFFFSCRHTISFR